MKKSKLKAIRYHILWNNQQEQRLTILSTSKEEGLNFIKRYTKPGAYIDKIYSQEIVSDIDYVDDAYVEVYNNE